MDNLTRGGRITLKDLGLGNGPLHMISVPLTLDDPKTPSNDTPQESSIQQDETPESEQQPPHSTNQGE